MASCKSMHRPIVPRRRRRSILLRLEDLEHRLVLLRIGADAPGFAVPTFVPGTAPFAMPAAGTGLGQIAPLLGASPQQLEEAYGINQIFFGTIKGDGAGQTVAIVDADDNPSFLDSSDPNFASSALAVYDQIFGLPNPPSFTKFNEYGDTAYSSLPPPNLGGWSVEIALDIEAVHAMAPDASIDLVEANPSSAGLYTAELTAASLPGVSVVSNSWGSDFENSLETSYDSYFMHSGVTFLAASGDGGSILTYPRGGFGYPPASPDVVAVGGTSVYLNAAGSWSGESGWSYGSDGYAGTAGSGGGISQYELEPSYQENVQNTGWRTVPDVAADADPSTALAEYDPFDFGTATPFEEIGGTSLAAPLWAGMIAIADQGRALDGAAPLTGYSQTLPALYSLPSTDFHQITLGYNGYSAGAGYNLVTGLGSPIGNVLIPQLAAYGLASQALVSAEPPSSVNAGDPFGVVVSADDANGNAGINFSGTATLSLKSGPAGATFTPVSVSVVDGQADFSGLTLSRVGGRYQFEVTIPGLASGSVTTTTVTVTAATHGIKYFYPLPTEASFQAAIDAAETDGAITSVIELTASTYSVTGGPLLIQPSGAGSATIFIVGQGASKTTISGGQSSRIFEIGGPGSSPTVVFQGLTIANGYATDDAGLGLTGSPAVGGAMVIDGASVSLSSVDLVDNEAAGAHGAFGVPAPEGSGDPGTNGGAGGNAMGGAIYLASGILSLSGSTIDGDFAQGGAGGAGGEGADGYSIMQTPSSGTEFIPHFNGGGAGGAGGAGGSGYGGGVYVGGGLVTLSGDTFERDLADGGAGGTGGFGGSVASVADPGGNGGNGGAGGNGAGGAVYVGGGSVFLVQSHLIEDAAVGFTGGVGGYGGRGGTGTSGSSGSAGGPGGQGGNGGSSGDGGWAAGGGLYVAGGAVRLSADLLADDGAIGGSALFAGAAGAGGPGGNGGIGVGTGAGGPGGAGGSAGHAGNGGNGGSAYGGGAAIEGGLVTFFNVDFRSDGALGGGGGSGGFGAVGGNGGAGGTGVSSGPAGSGGAGGAAFVGGAGGNGGAAYGGGVYLGAGSLSWTLGSIRSSAAIGGAGGAGGQGGFGGSGGAGGIGIVTDGPGGPGGAGGTGGAGGFGGSASGGGIYFTSSANVTLTRVLMTGNTSIAGPNGPAGGAGFTGAAGPAVQAGAASDVTGIPALLSSRPGLSRAAVVTAAVVDRALANLDVPSAGDPNDDFVGAIAFESTTQRPLENLSVIETFTVSLIMKSKKGNFSGLGSRPACR